MGPESNFGRTRARVIREPISFAEENSGTPSGYRAGFPSRKPSDGRWWCHSAVAALLAAPAYPLLSLFPARWRIHPACAWDFLVGTGARLSLSHHISPEVEPPPWPLHSDPITIWTANTW